MKTGTTVRKYLSEEKQDYVNYIYKMLENDGILVASSIDENDQVYLDWKEEKSHSESFFNMRSIMSGLISAPLILSRIIMMQMKSMTN